jgi:hypothetical protein
MILISMMLGLGVAEAAPPRPLNIEEASTRDRLLETFAVHFFPERVEAESLVHSHGIREVSASAAAEEGEGFGCLTTLVAELKIHWDLFDVEERAEMTAILAPWKPDLIDPGWSSEDGPPPPDSPCFGYNYDNYTDSEHFSVQWEDNAITEAEAEAFSDSLEYSWDVQVDDLGWEQPTGTNSYPILVMVPRENSYAGAYTTVEYCSGAGYMPYIVAYSGSFNTGNWWKTMACHEFNHAVQFAYGYAHEFWWWEATATWIEEYVYPAYNDWADMTYVYSLVPYIGMNASQGSSSDEYLFYHTYAMAVWAFFLDEKVGGQELVEKTWQRASLQSGQYNYWMPETIDDVGEEFDELYLEFMATNASMDYNESSSFYEPELTDTVSNLPDDGGDRSSDTPQSLGQNFIKFKRAAGEEGATLRVNFDGENGPDWYAVLAKGSSSLADYVVFDLDGSGEGTAEIEFDGDYDVFLVVSPMDEDAQGYSYNWNNADEYGYSWDAELITDGSGDGGDDGGGSDDTGSDGSGASDGGDDSSDSGFSLVSCGCSAGSLAGGLSMACLLGILGRVRRQR